MSGSRIKQLRKIALDAVCSQKFPGKSLKQLSDADQALCYQYSALLFVELKRRWKDSTLRLSAMHEHVKLRSNRYAQTNKTTSKG